MGLRAVRQQVSAILESNGLRSMNRDGEFVLRFASALIAIAFEALGEQTVITLRSPVLRSVDTREGALAAILQELNARNQVTRFGKWTLHEQDGLISLEHDLLGDDLQENELMTVLATLARVADQQDDRLLAKFGGVRAFDER